MFSFGIEPSITSTNGASSSSSSAWRKGARNSSPPSVGERTLLCRWTFGSPGMAPSSTSSIEGWPAAVMETVSPSQLIPSEIQRMCTSSTPGGLFGSVDMRHPFLRHLGLFQLERVHEELLALRHVHVQPAAPLARHGEGGHRPLGPAPAAAQDHRDLAHHELRAADHRPLGDEGEGERERIGHDLPQVADADLDARHAALAGVPGGDLDDGVGERELVHQQILGSGSPTSWSITRRPPNAVCTITMPGGSVRTSPMSAARSPPGAERSAASAAAACSGSTAATSTPSLATCIGSIPRISVAPATAGCTGTA